MNNDMKYITFYGSLAIEIVLFPNFRTHSDFVETLNIKNQDIIGAGFVKFDNSGGEPFCYGESVSLGKKSSEFDTHILWTAIGWDS